jgi:hypothetical protein
MKPSEMPEEEFYECLKKNIKDLGGAGAYDAVFLTVSSGTYPLIRREALAELPKEFREGAASAPGADTFAFAVLSWFGIFVYDLPEISQKKLGMLAMLDLYLTFRGDENGASPEKQLASLFGPDSLVAHIEDGKKIDINKPIENLAYRAIAQTNDWFGVAEYITNELGIMFLSPSVRKSIRGHLKTLLIAIAATEKARSIINRTMAHRGKS